MCQTIRARGGFHFSGVTGGFAIKYVVRGAELYTVDNHRILVNRTELILLPCDKPYIATHFPAKVPLNSETDGLCVDIDCGRLHQVLSINPNADFYQIPLRCRYSTALGKTLGQWTASNTTNNAVGLINNLTDQLANFLTELEVLQDRLGSVTKKTNTLKELTVKLIAAREYVHCHYRETVRLQDLAQSCGLSKFHLQRLFRYSFDLSPLAMQHQLRMLEARRLILKAGQSLTHIAMGLGYSDLPAFSRQFVKYWGVTPSRLQN